MSQEVAVLAPAPPVEAYETHREPLQPSRSLAQHVSAGTVAIEQERAIAEVQAKIMMAIRFPRNKNFATEEIARSCQELSLAEEAFYEYKRGGETIGGPSIRLAEELARCWGNIEYGIRELSQKDGVSEMQAYAWDKQTNTESAQTFTVRHIRDTSNGPKTLTSQRDIYELTANLGGRRLRARILALMPKWFVRLAEDECRKTLRAGDQISIAERARKMLAEFVRLGVGLPLIEKKIGKKVDQISGDDLVDLRAIFTAIKDGASSVAEQFQTADGGGLGAALTAATTAPAQPAKQESAATAPAAEQAAPLASPAAKTPARIQRGTSTKSAAASAGTAPPAATEQSDQSGDTVF